MTGEGGSPGDLSGRAYWDSVHSGKDRPANRRKISWEDRLLFGRIYPAHLPTGAGRAVEIGSAPGRHLVTLHELFGYEVWGIEYSGEGAEANRRRFGAAGIDPGNVIEADVFGDEIAREYTGFFDIVISRGFIEHFDDPQRAVERHMLLLRPGGTLVVSIPNMRGANYLQAALFNRPLIPIHNREIMRMESFRALFDRQDLETAFCGRYGTFKTDLFIHRRGPFTAVVQRAAYLLQALLDRVFPLFLRGSTLETPLFSPNLLFIGRKKH
jgi:SAM-dependent methyltransferase